MAEWAALHTDILVLIAKRIEIFEDYFNFYAVCKSWHSVTSVLGKVRTLPSRFPFVMLTDKAESNFPQLTEDMEVHSMLIEEVGKNEQIEGMQNRQFYSFLTSKVYEFELPEATRRRCLGAGYGLLLTIGYDLQMNILNPFTRQQISLPSMSSFNLRLPYGPDDGDDSEVGDDSDEDDEGGYDAEEYCQLLLHYFVAKVAMSSNPFDQSNQDCIVFAIYGERPLLAFARPGDECWTDICISRETAYTDVICYKDKFYAVDNRGVISCGDINDAANGLKATPIARFPDTYRYKYLVESSGDILLVVRRCLGPYHEIDTEDPNQPDVDKEDPNQPYNYTSVFLIFKLEECGDGDNSDDYAYKLTEVKNLGNNALFIGTNASVSVPASRCVKANSIYFSENHVEPYSRQPYGGGYDTGNYDVESGKVTLHYASKFMSHLTPPMWIVT